MIRAIDPTVLYKVLKQSKTVLYRPKKRLTKKEEG